MRTLILSTMCALSACAPEAAAPVRSEPQSACAERSFEATTFTLCSVKGARIEIHSAPKGGPPYRSFAALEAALGDRAGQIAFAMNAGMFDEDGRAIGLLVEDSKQLRAINRRKGGGNFHLLPNGVFLIASDGKPAVVKSEDYIASNDIEFATQSGPMLVMDGELHPSFDADGTSRHIRNGVGIARDGSALFVISKEEVSFGKLARFFRDGLGAKNALYFDGSVSALWDPANGRRDAIVPIGPMVVVFKPAASAPGREGRATP